jgi:hypothetical protein
MLKSISESIHDGSFLPKQALTGEKPLRQKGLR